MRQTSRGSAEGCQYSETRSLDRAEVNPKIFCGNERFAESPTHPRDTQRYKYSASVHPLPNILPPLRTTHPHPARLPRPHLRPPSPRAPSRAGCSPRPDTGAHRRPHELLLRAAYAQAGIEGRAAGAAVHGTRGRLSRGAASLLLHSTPPPRGHESPPYVLSPADLVADALCHIAMAKSRR
jgi:hypothetical protein